MYLAPHMPVGTLVFTHGIDIGSVSPKDLYISDHKCILFDICFKLESQPSCHMRHYRFINKTAAVNFSMVFDSNVVLDDKSVDTVVQSFNNYCSSVLDKVAPLKLRKTPSKNLSHWINETIRSFRRKCYMTEQLWKAIKLVYKLHLRDLIGTLNV